MQEARRAIHYAGIAKDRPLWIEAKMSECLLLARLGRNCKSFEGYKALLRPLKSFGNGRYLAEAHNNMASLIAQHGDYAEAWKHLKQAAQLWEFCGDENRLLSVKLNMCNVLFHTERLNRARELLGAVFRHIAKGQSFEDVFAHALLLRAHDRCVRKRDWKRGLEDFKKSLTIQLKNREVRYLAQDSLTTFGLLKKFWQEQNMNMKRPPKKARIEDSLGEVGVLLMKIRSDQLSINPV